MRDVIWVAKSDRPEQLPILILAVWYCVAIIFDILVIRVSFIFFEILIILVGIAYLISSYKSSVKVEHSIIGSLWIFIGFIIGVKFQYKYAGIPIAVIGSSIGYFLVMCAIAITIARRRVKYRNYFCYLLCLVYTLFMAIVHIVAFLGVSTRMGYFHFADSFIYIGESVIFLSQYSTLEFISMLVVILSLVLQVLLSS